MTSLALRIDDLQRYEISDGETRRFIMTGAAILACLIALLYVWIPSNAEKDGYRSLTIHQPPIGRWLSGEQDLLAVRGELLAMQKRAENMPRGSYTAEAHVADMGRLIDLEKSVMPIEGGTVFHGVTPLHSVITDNAGHDFNGTLYMALPLMFSQTRNDLTVAFDASSESTKEKFAELSRVDSLSQRDARPIVERSWNAKALLLWMVRTHLKSMLVVLFLFLIRAQIIGQKKRILVYDMHKTFFWMLCWPIGIWKYPTADALALARILRKRLAMAFSFLLSTALPNLLAAQTGTTETRRDTITLVDTNSTLKTRNAISEGVETVNKYQGMAVGEIFAKTPGIRNTLTYTRSIGSLDLHFASWNSFGKGSNQETDLTVGVTGHGFGLFGTHMLVPGGDVEALNVSKSGTVRAGGVTLPLNAGLSYFYGTAESSPPGGISFKLGSEWSHGLPLLPSVVRVTHSVTAGADNNPFNLGKGVSAIGFYTGELNVDGVYVDWNATRPVAGQENTSRGFRNSFAVGFRRTLSW